MNEYTKESIEYKGYTIEIVSDNDPQNPRTDWDPAGVMCCWHSRYNLGDMDGRKTISDQYSEPIDLLYELAGIGREAAQEENYIQGIIRNLNSWLDSKNKQIETIPYDELYEFIGDYSYGRNYADENDYSLYLVARFMEETVYDSGCEHEDLSYSELYDRIDKKGTIILPLSLYDHSGISMSVGSPTCRWDGSRVGWIYMTKDTMEKEGWTKEQATKYLEGEVETYDQYLTGDVWGWRVIDSDEDIVHSCYGYYGANGVKDAIETAKSEIDYLCKKAQEEYEKTQPKRKAAEMYMI